MTEKVIKKLPHFIIVGSMKSATTTIYEQLKSLDGIFMPELKEPNFFSDQDQYDRGMKWYELLFADAKAGDIIGEASTHYTKRPTYKETVDRIYSALPSAKIIYIMRDPVDRLVSQYIHEWTCNNISCDIEEAIEKHPELIKYSCYFYQIKPYIDRFGLENVLPVFFERIKNSPESELKRISRFIGYGGRVAWTESSTKTNVSSERLRLSPLMQFMVDSRVLSFFRKNFLPVPLRTWIKTKYQMKKRPAIGEDAMYRITDKINKDFINLGNLLGVTLTVENYKSTVLDVALDWIGVEENLEEASVDGG